MQESTTKTSANPAPADLLPYGWDPKQAGDCVLARLIKVTAPEVKGAHDTEFVCVGGGKRGRALSCLPAVR